MVLFIVVGLGHTGIAQSRDSVYYQLQEVEIKPVSGEARLRLTSSESIIDKEDLKKQGAYSIVSALNTVAGVRMEERSPGSYRLSIRGSLLRSPFGVRNIKIYLGELPFTDAGGNTYLNSLDVANLNSIRVLKGPEASIFGANTGGVLLIDPVYKTPDSLKLAASVSGGSFGLYSENVLFQKRSQKHLLTLNQAFQRADGYRENSAMQKHYLQVSDIFSYHSNAQLKVLVLFSDLYYQTPGGLTLQQFKEDPQRARPATATLPGASSQRAAIYNKTLFGGITHDVNLSRRIRHVISVFGSYTDFKNPFITNYEDRKESTYGARTYVDVSLVESPKFKLKWHIGAEWQQTDAGITNYTNRLGNKEVLMASDQINTLQYFGFTKLLTDINERLLVEASLSYNVFAYRYKSRFPLPQASFGKRHFSPQWMPRIGASYQLSSIFSWRVSAGGGYSPPSIAEVRSSNTLINTNLQAETGQNYETGFRLKDQKGYFLLDASVFHYTLNNAIVRRTDANSNEYFVNAGGTKQNGLEVQASLWIIKSREDLFIKALQIKGNISYNHFLFSNYVVNANDYSGNSLTGVPDYTSAESLYIEFPYRLGLSVNYYYCASIPLNDAGTAKAAEYHLAQLKAEWTKVTGRIKLTLFAGIDNLFNQTYSLGNDLNAAGDRYYNTAAPRNYYGGIKGEF